MDNQFINLIRQGDLVLIQDFYKNFLLNNSTIDFENIFFEACVQGN